MGFGIKNVSFLGTGGKKKGASAWVPCDATRAASASAEQQVRGRRCASNAGKSRVDNVENPEKRGK